MAIMAILASVIAPSIFDDIKRARQDKESLTLEGIGQHLVNYVLENKRIPSRTTADWTAAIAGQGTLSSEKIEFNERGFRRGYYADPRFFTTTDSAFGGYSQTTGLVSPPVSPRIMLISSLTAHAPAAPTTAATFNSIWDQSTGTSVVEGADLKIVRINLRALFHRVILTNEHTSQPAYQLEMATPSAMPAASGGVDGLITRYVLDKTRVNLLSDPFPSGGLNQVVMVDAPTNYTYRTSGAVWEWQKP